MGFFSVCGAYDLFDGAHAQHTYEWNHRWSFNTFLFYCSPPVSNIVISLPFVLCLPAGTIMFMTSETWCVFSRGRGERDTEIQLMDRAPAVYFTSFHHIWYVQRLCCLLVCECVQAGVHVCVYVCVDVAFLFIYLFLRFLFYDCPSFGAIKLHIMHSGRYNCVSLDKIKL